MALKAAHAGHALQRMMCECLKGFRRGWPNLQSALPPCCASLRSRVAYQRLCQWVCCAGVSLGAGTEGTMTAAVKRPQASPAHPEEWFSILLALGATAACILFFLYEPRFEPVSPLAWAIPGWLAGAYLFTQIF